MKTKLVLLVVGTLFMIGCTATARLYPVKGPLFDEHAAPIVVTVTGTFKPGTISFRLPDGEVCKGRWKTMRGGETPTQTPETQDSQVAWDTVYGSGFYVAHIVGAKLYAQARVTGNKGASFNIEIYEPQNGNVRDPNAAASTKGVATEIVKAIFTSSSSGKSQAPGGFAARANLSLRP